MTAVSANPYTAQALELIHRHKGGRILDCGAGLRKERFDHVCCCDPSLNEGISLLAHGERLPFQDDAFDAILSLAVLEHTPDPAMHASELIRVLKPGGEILVDAAFLQPWHGYPSHWFAFTRCGLEKLFAQLEILQCDVGPHQQPWVGLRWFLERFVAGISDPSEKDVFLSQSLRETLASWTDLAPPDEALMVDTQATEVLAAGFSLHGRKRQAKEKIVSLTQTATADPVLMSRINELVTENRELNRRLESIQLRQRPWSLVKSRIKRVLAWLQKSK